MLVVMDHCKFILQIAWLHKVWRSSDSSSMLARLGAGLSPSNVSASSLLLLGIKL